MNLSISRALPAILLLILPLTACVHTTTHLYRGDMELVAVSGDSCPEKNTASSHIPLELVLERNSSIGGHLITGYLNGPDIQTGYFSGNDITQLPVVYPDETGSAAQGHTLMLVPAPDGVNGELREKPRGTSSGCYFEKAALRLKHAAAGDGAKAAFDRQRKLFSAEEHYSRGQALLKADNPGEALRDLAESLRLRVEVNPGDPNNAYPTFSIAIAHEMSGRQGEALALLRDLLKEKPETGIDILKQRMIVSSGLCAYTFEAGDDARQRFSEQLMAAVAQEFGGLKGVGDVLDECYRELGQERLGQGDPDLSMQFFRKALTLNPEDSESIIGVVAGFIANDNPAEGRRFLQEHAQIVIDKAGRDSYNGNLSFLYVAEAGQAEKAGDYARAEQLLREALRIIHGERTLIINLSRVLGKAAKPDEARKLLEDAGKECGNEACRREYADELVRQERIERILKRLKRERQTAR